MYKKQKKLVIHAPNVHTGGGLTLLKELLAYPNQALRWMQVDERASGLFAQPVTIKQTYIKRSICSRLVAEWRLWYYVSCEDVVLCFHGLPPLLPLSAHVIVFAQNRLLVEKTPLRVYSPLTSIRLLVERLWLTCAQHHADRYIVQSPSMAVALKKHLKNKSKVSVLPFTTFHSLEPDSNSTNSVRKFDFVYVADGEPHKNHTVLLSAWCLLAEQGFKPSLALTVSSTLHASLANDISEVTKRHSLNIVNLGQLSHKDIHHLYQASSALIYPSRIESLGLPLIEAKQYGLSILAPELDYVRDIVEPVETFNPDSPVSVARSVRRFLGQPEKPVEINSVSAFLADVLR
jgi:glycosyltransferase involved in cell wall biosynthesis